MRGNPQIPPNDDFKKIIAPLSIDELNDLRNNIAKSHSELIRQVAISRSKIEIIRAMIFNKKNGGDIGISDHAVLRYLERHKGVDVRAARLEISGMAAEYKRSKDARGHCDVGNGVTLVVPQGDIVATVL